ncbi:hypothetical protein RchiOBHm_Chr2g0086581 [Rosa chinensis]|uniref:Uncharacterized protein n=1 Tax=Rosa chinensis TaxID=74649 RepID=A0A2P6RIF2_ROSCH|nr:hypothetical protein RchiOBHm_Chr2g0086581 [Rosa chinensis]
MTTLGVSGMIFQCVFEGSLSMQDTEIERRPYHKNCNCALHKSKGGACLNACPQRNISFPKKQSWTDGSLCMSAATSKVSSHPRNTSNKSTGNREVVNGVQSLSHRQYKEVSEAC